jgi:FkbM family methyltransferase
MSWISYAQNFEDVLLNRVFGQRPSGFWIDVGACDPVELSLTKHLSDLGWRGINIDASPIAHALLAAGRPRDLNLNIGISDSAGIKTFYRAIRGPAGEPASGLSTFNAEEVARHRERGFVFEELRVPTAPLAAVCEEHGVVEVDFMSIDVEGGEEQVLRGADFARFRPRVLIVEATRPLSQQLTHDAWEGLLLGAGYEFATFDGLNRWYVRSEDRPLAALLQVPPNVFDDFVPWTYVRRIRELEARNAELERRRRETWFRRLSRKLRGARP